MLDVAEILAYVAQVLASVALLYVALSFLVSRNQLNHGVIASCNERFQKIIPWLESKDRKDRKQAERQYVDLCNEQLFYFRNRYLPREVIVEWLDGMIEFLPQLDKEGNAYPDEQRERMINDLSLLRDYPRVTEAFTVDRFHKLSDDPERERLIKKIRRNIKKHRFGRRFT